MSNLILILNCVSTWICRILIEKLMKVLRNHKKRNYCVFSEHYLCIERSACSCKTWPLLKLLAGNNQQVQNTSSTENIIVIYIFIHSFPVAYAENLHRGGFIQWRMVVICLWCAVFVKSQFDVIFMFPNHRFGEVCWYNMHILPHAPLPRCFMCHCTEYKLSVLQVRISEENKLNAATQEFITAQFWLRVEKGE